MSLTRRQLQELHEERPRQVDLASTPRPGRSIRAWLTDPEAVPARWSAGLGLAWVLVWTAVLALQPEPTDADAVAPLWAVLVLLALMAALMGMGMALARRQRAGMVASVAAAGFFLLDSVLCPVSGHHGTVGTWWFAQMAGFTALVGLGLAGLRASARPPAGDGAEG